MKRINSIFFAAMAAALSLLSCSQENLTPIEKPQCELVTVHFGAESGIASTKATLTTEEDEATFRSAWTDGDVLSVEYLNGQLDEDVVLAEWTGSYFKAVLPDFQGDWDYDALYPAPSSTGTIDFGSSRIQNGNEYNSVYDLMKGSADAKNAEAGKDDDGNNIIFKMDRQTAIAYFHLTGELDEEVVSATLSVEGEAAVIATKSVKVSTYSKGYEFVKDATNGLKEITINFEEGTAPKASDLKLWFNVLPTDYTSMKLEVETKGHKLTLNNKKQGSYTAANLYKVVKTISMSQWAAKSAPVEAKELVFGFKSSSPAGWPTSSNGAKAGTYNYTIDGVSYSFIHGSGIYCGGTTPNSGYLFITKNSTLGLPAIEGYRLAKVVGTLNDSGSPSIKAGISVTDGTDVVLGGTVQTWNTKGADYTYTLTDTKENTVYYLSVTTANCQMINLKLSYESATPSAPTCATPVITLDGAVASITCTTEGAEIHYTVGESPADPTANDAVYSSPVTLTEGETIKTIAVKDGMKDSTIASKKYTAIVVTKTSILTLSTNKKFGTKTGSTLKADDNIVWTVNTTSTTGAIQNSYQNNYKGQQFGTSSAAWEGTFDADFSGKQISKIEITANTGNNATVTAKVDDSNFGESVSITKQANKEVVYTFDGSANGKISLVVSNTSAAFYLGKIKVTYTE